MHGKSASHSLYLHLKIRTSLPIKKQQSKKKSQTMILEKRLSFYILYNVVTCVRGVSQLVAAQRIVLKKSACPYWRSYGIYSLNIFSSQFQLKMKISLPKYLLIHVKIGQTLPVQKKDAASIQNTFFKPTYYGAFYPKPL